MQTNPYLPPGVEATDAALTSAWPTLLESLLMAAGVVFLALSLREFVQAELVRQELLRSSSFPDQFVAPIAMSMRPVWGLVWSSMGMLLLLSGIRR